MAPVAVAAAPTPTAADDACGCLEAAVKAAQPYAAATLKSSNGVYSDVQILADPPDTIEYRLVYATQLVVAPGQPDAYFGTQLAKLQGTCDTEIVPAMARMNIAHPQARFTFVNADGSIVWTHTFRPS